MRKQQVLFFGGSRKRYPMGRMERVLWKAFFLILFAYSFLSYFFLLFDVLMEAACTFIRRCLCSISYIAQFWFPRNLFRAHRTCTRVLFAQLYPTPPCCRFSFPHHRRLKQTAKGSGSSASASSDRIPVSSRLVAYPVDQKLPIRQLPRIHNPRANPCLAGLEAQQRRYRSDCVQGSQRRSRNGRRHHLRSIELDGSKEDAALGLADAGGDEAAEERLDGAAGRTPGGGPEGEERRLERGGEGEEGGEGSWGADAILMLSVKSQASCSSPTLVGTCMYEYCTVLV